MKTNIFIAFATVLLVVTYLLVLRIQPDEPSDMAKCIPSTALIYFEQHNGFELLSDLSASLLGEKIKSIDFAAVAKEIGLAPKHVAAINNFTMVIKFARTDPLIKELFGNGFALALLPPLNLPPSSPNKGDDFLLENLVLIAEPQQPAKILELMAATVKGLVNNGAWTSVFYGQHQILRIQGNGQSFSLVKLDDFFLIGQNERQVRRCIDTYDGEQPSFSNNAEFVAIKNSILAPDIVLAVPLQDGGKNLASLSPDFDLRDHPFLARISPLMAGIKGFGYSAKRRPADVSEKILVHFDSQNIADPVRDEPSHPPGRPAIFSLATENPMLCLWSNRLNLKQILAMIESETKQAVGDRVDLSRLETFIDKIFKQLSLLGGEITVIAEPGKKSSSLPIPLVTIFVPVGDKDALKATLTEMFDTYTIPMKTSEYGPAEYAYWSQSPQDGLFPLCGFWGELFYFGNSFKLLHKIIDNQGHGLSLVESDLVKTIDTGLAHGDDAVMYSNNEQLIDLLENILNIVGTVIALEDRELAMKAQVVIHKILVPLLDGAKMYTHSVTTRNSGSLDMVVFDVITNISKFPLEPKE